MVFTVRCFKCGEPSVRLVLGGRAILHARCHSCSANLLSEVLEYEQEILTENKNAAAEKVADPPTGEFELPDEDEITVGETA